MERKMLGTYIVIDPKICHGKPTIAGTRIMVWQVLSQVERGDDWSDIVEDWGGKVPKEAIAEAVKLAGRAFLEHAQEYGLDPVSAA